MINRVVKVFVCLFFATSIIAQPVRKYSVQNAHSHNDYYQKHPFDDAYNAGFGSIEVDVFPNKERLYVAHQESEIDSSKTLEILYLIPLHRKVLANGGYPYSDTTKHLQLLVEAKGNPEKTIDILLDLLKKYPALTNAKNLSWVITGNQPDEKYWDNYPTFITFDGNFQKKYSKKSLQRVRLFSADLSSFTKWNGKSNIDQQSMAKLNQLIKHVHEQGKKVRFWNAPDFVNAWYQLMNLNVDYINTDRITSFAQFLHDIPRQSFQCEKTYSTYSPQYKNDGENLPIKNVILFIGDGCGLSQLYAGYTANKGQLNIFNMLSTGHSKTTAYDSYITDSAPGSTAFSSGHKTCNRFVGVDHIGVPLKLLPEYLAEKGIETGIITTGDVTDATPADFYAHNISRDNAADIFKDLAKSSIKLLMGRGNKAYNSDVAKLLSDSGFYIFDDIHKIDKHYAKCLVMEKQAGLSVLEGRGDWMTRAFSASIEILRKNDNGFFLMVEGAQIDYGGHAMNLPYVVTEVQDMDKVVGEAMKFADEDGQTLVIVLADHETGGLTLLDGDLNTGYVAGHFSTNDHTAVPVPVFAYGPQSKRFIGVYENTEVFEKLLQVFKCKK